jgi:hypothetical protein
MLSQLTYKATFVALFFLAFVISVAAQEKANTEKQKSKVYSQYQFDPARSISNRILPTAPSVLRIFEEADMSPVEHPLSKDERAIVDSAINMLPPLHKKILKERLRSLNFLDSMPNTALTSRVNPDDEYQLFDITIRAATLHQTVSDWLTEKERSCFDTTGSNLRVTVEAGFKSALYYILLHESTHVVDASLHITPQQKNDGYDTMAGGKFIEGTWSERTTPASKFSDSLLEQTRFRRGGRIFPIARAGEIYTALKRTPFTSLYSISSWHEDLAEFVTIYHFTQKEGLNFSITVKDGDKLIFRYEPMKAAIVQSRKTVMSRFYE